jgi:hypothetical protein
LESLHHSDSTTDAVAVYKGLGKLVKQTFERPIKAGLQAIKKRLRRRDIETAEDLALCRVKKVEVEES